MSLSRGKDLVPNVVCGGTDRPVLLETLDSFQLDKLPYVEFLKKDQLPETAGIYFAVDKDQKVWYIGKAQNLKYRWVGHHRYDKKKSEVRSQKSASLMKENNFRQGTKPTRIKRFMSRQEVRDIIIPYFKPTALVVGLLLTSDF